MSRSVTTPEPQSDDPQLSDFELLEITEEISRRIRAGENVQIEDFAPENSERLNQLRQILPTLQALAELGHSQDQTNSIASANITSEITQHSIGDYRVIRKIGQGGMGVVYESEQLSLKRRVALKVLPFAAVLDERQIQRFKNESLAAAQLDHPNVVDVYGVGCERGVHFLCHALCQRKKLGMHHRTTQRIW